MLSRRIIAISRGRLGTTATKADTASSTSTDGQAGGEALISAEGQGCIYGRLQVTMGRSAGIQRRRGCGESQDVFLFSLIASFIVECVIVFSSRAHPQIC